MEPPKPAPAPLVAVLWLCAAAPWLFHTDLLLMGLRFQKLYGHFPKVIPKVIERSGPWNHSHGGGADAIWGKFGSDPVHLALDPPKWALIFIFFLSAPLTLVLGTFLWTRLSPRARWAVIIAFVAGWGLLCLDPLHVFAWWWGD